MGLYCRTHKGYGHKNRNEETTISNIVPAHKGRFSSISRSSWETGAGLFNEDVFGEGSV